MPSLSNGVRKNLINVIIKIKMAATKTETGAALRINSLLKVKKFGPNDHPLHLFISRKNASHIGIPEDQETCYLSLWTNTKLEDDSVQPTHPFPGKSSIFQRMLSNSQNFPEILIPDTEDVDTDHDHSYVTGADVELFTYVVIGNALAEDELPSVQSRLDLICSDEFMTHYNIQSDFVYVRPVRAHPVSNVVLGVSSHEAFQWVTNKNFCNRLLVEVCKNTVLVRARDVFLSPYGGFLDDPDFKRAFYFDMYVLESSPVQQGLITVSTEMVVTYLGDLKAERERFQERIQFIVSNPRKQIGGPFKVMISDFSQALNQNLNKPSIDEADEHPGPAFRKKAQAMKKRRGRSETVGVFEYEVVSQKPLFKRMLWREQKKHYFDPLYYIGMSRKLMLKEGLFDSSYVLITPEYMEDETDDTQRVNVQTERLCMIRCLGKEYDKSRRIFISPLCLFNILKKPPIELPERLIIKRYDTGTGFPSESMTSSQSYDVKVPMAKEVQISIIPSPNYSPRAPHAEALKQYFSCKRLVALGDVLAIRSSDDPQFWQNTGDDTENRFPCIYFKVVNIKGPPVFHKNYLMDSNGTLIQIGTEHSYIPAMMQIYLSPLPQGFWDRDGLSGMSNYVSKLENFILPHLTSEHGSKGLSSVPPAILVSGPVGSGKTSLIVAVARRLFIHAFKVNCHALAGETSGATEARMKNAFNAASLYSPCILLLQSVHAVGRDRDGNTEDPRVASSFLANVMQLKNDLQQYPVVVVATTHSTNNLTHDMLECFLHHVEIEVPTEIDRVEIMDGLLHTMVYSGNISVPYIAQRTAGFVLGDLAALVAHAKREAFRRIVKQCCGGKLRPSLAEEEDLLAAGLVVQHTDFNTALDQLQAAHSDAIGAPKIPNVGWDDVGGLSDVKLEILDTIQLPLQYPEILAAGLRRSGVLLYGPPGTGKTLLAKAVATECSLNFLSVKGPELLNMYVGQSEENVREVFRRARSATPCVIFFDELDSLAPNRGKSGDSGGVMDRVVSQLLAELDGLNKSGDVFVIGATNRPDLIDPALLRPGRFDKLLYLGVSEDHASQMSILEALTRKFNLSPDFSMERFIEKCPMNLTGADMYALASDAMLNAVKRKIKALDGNETDDQTVVVEERDFQFAADNITPSVTAEELERYKSLQYHFGVKPHP